MKKSIVLLLILSIITISCDRLMKKPDSKLAKSSAFSTADSISLSLAKKMILHYNDSVVNHNSDAILKQITLYNSDLYLIFKNFPNITRIRLMTAAYLDDASVVDTLRNRVTLIVQLKVGYNSEYFYYDINSFGDGRICPPPPGCSPNLSEDL